MSTSKGGAHREGGLKGGKRAMKQAQAPEAAYSFGDGEDLPVGRALTGGTITVATTLLRVTP